MAQVKVEYKEHVWTFDPNKFMNVELIAVERQIGMTSMEFQDGLNRGSVLAITALIWLMLKRHGMATPFDDIEFSSDEFDISPVPDSSDPESTEGKSESSEQTGEESTQNAT